MGGFTSYTSCKYCRRQITKPNLLRHEFSCLENPNIKVTMCKRCGSEPVSKKRKSCQFCSRECAYRFKEESNGLRDKRCESCGSMFSIENCKRGYYRKTCSKKCLSALISKNSRENIRCGGNGCGPRSKKTIYKGYTFDSSWEANLAEWMDNREIAWIRDRSIIFRWKDDEKKFVDTRQIFISRFSECMWTLKIVIL